MGRVEHVHPRSGVEVDDDPVRQRLPVPRLLAGQVEHAVRAQTPLPIVHCGTWSSRAARFASHTSVAVSSATT